MDKVIGNKVYSFDGNQVAVKTINPWDVDDNTGWTVLSGAPQGEEKTTKDYFSRVPWLRRGVSLIATGVSGMPFKITNFGSDKEIDNSDNYQNKVKFLPNPNKLFWLMAASRQLTGRFYSFKVRNKTLTLKLKYLIPTSVTPKYSDAEKNVGELIAFLRKYQRPNGVLVEKEVKLEDIVYSWMADPYIEIGPPNNYPAKSALAASGVLFNLDEAVAGYFQGGMMKRTLLFTSTTTRKEHREELESWWNKFMAGVRNVGRQKVLNADVVNPVVVGEGLDGLHESKLTDAKRQDIAAAFGIPFSKLFSTEASGFGGGGVVKEDDLRFLEETLIPETEAIYEDLNEQVFHPAKYHIEINEQAIDAFQEDEKERAGSLLALTSAISANPIAAEFGMSLLGFELSDEQKKLFEALKKDKEAQRQVFNARVNNNNGNLNGNKPMADVAPRGEDMPMRSMLKELGQWQRNALRLGAERSATEFATEHLGEDMKSFIRECLEQTKTKENIKSLFAGVRSLMEQGSPTPPLVAAVRAALKKATTAKKIDAVFADLSAERK